MTSCQGSCRLIDAYCATRVCFPGNRISDTSLTLLIGAYSVGEIVVASA